MAHQSSCRIQEADVAEKDEVYLRGYVSRLVCDEMAVLFLETCVPKKQVKCNSTTYKTYNEINEVITIFSSHDHVSNKAHVTNNQQESITYQTNTITCFVIRLRIYEFGL